MTLRPSDATTAGARPPARRRPAARRAFGALAAGLAAALVVPLLGSVVVPADAADATPRKIVSGWIPYWTTTSGTAATVANKDLFTDVSPFWHAAQWSSGASSIIEQGSTANNDTAQSDLQGAGILVLPSVTDGMPAKQMASVMKDSTLRSRLVNQLVSTVMNNGYDGIDLDFEKFAFSDGSSTWSTTRPAWVTFIKQLASSLHSRGKLLSVTTPPIYNADRDSTSGYWVYDWAGIGAHVDRLRIMTYDYSVSGGNIAPFPWVEKVVAFAVTQVPSGKVQVGVPAYGRDDYKSVTGTCPNFMPSNWNSGTPSVFTAKQASSWLPLSGDKTTAYGTTTIVKHKVTPVWSTTYKEYSFSYTVSYTGQFTSSTGVTSTKTCTATRAGWYDEDRAAVERAKLVGKYRLLGIAQWTLGGQDDTQWAPLRSYATTIAPSTTKVAVSVAASTVYGSPATVTAVATADGVAVNGATASLQVRPTGSTSAWTQVATGTTSSAGLVSFATTPITAGTDVRVAVAGAWDRKAASGYSATKVRDRVVTTLPSPTAAAGTSVRVKVQVDPRVKGQRIRLQELRSGSWVTIASAYANTYGRAYFPVVAPKAGATRTLRAQALSTGAIVGNVSAKVVLTGA